MKKKKIKIRHLMSDSNHLLSSISPPSVTLARKHQAMRRLYYVGAEYKNLNGDFLSGWSQGLTNKTRRAVR